MQPASRGVMPITFYADVPGSACRKYGTSVSGTNSGLLPGLRSSIGTVHDPREWGQVGQFCAAM